MEQLIKNALFLTFILILCNSLQNIQANELNDRIDCRTIEEQIDKKECLRRECKWDETHKNNSNAPLCFVDKRIGYEVQRQSKNSNSILATLKLTNPETHEINCTRLNELNLEVFYVTEKIVRLKIDDVHPVRYQVPIQKNFNISSFSEKNGRTKMYDVVLNNGDASIIIQRNDIHLTLINTTIGGMIFCDKYLQFSTYLPTETDYYGFGENYRTTLRHDLDYKTFPLFSRNRPIREKDRNGFGQHPFMMGVHKNGKAFGLFFLNSNAMAYTFLPAPALSMKMTGGIIDVFVFIGSNPEEVVSLYTSVIGRPMLSPFWSLGFQNAYTGYKNTEDVNKTIQRYFRHNVPLDVQYLHSEYMQNSRDFTIDSESFKNLSDLIKNGLHWSLALYPSIEAIQKLSDDQDYKAFVEGYKNDVFIRWPAEVGKKISFPPGVPKDKFVLYGKTLSDGPAAFPDFLKESTKKWWFNNIKELSKQLDFVTAWLDMNEPTNFDKSVLEYKCPNDEYFLRIVGMKFEEPLNTQTICMDVPQGENAEFKHYDVHSIYGLTQSIVTVEAIQNITGTRSFVLSRSTYPSSGKYVGHVFTENSAEWEHLRQSIVAMLEFSMFGISMTGADICGFNGISSPDLCRRWYQLGAFYPISRVSSNIEKDPGWWAENGHPEVTKAAVESLRLRYQFLHYFYTCLYRSHAYGETFARPMHHVFLDDEKSRKIDSQFFLGPSVMVAPFLDPNQEFLSAYLPSSEPDWYKLKDDFVEKVYPVSNNHRLEDYESSRSLFLRGGSILPIVSITDLPHTLNTISFFIAPISLWVLPNYEGSAYGMYFHDNWKTNSIENSQYMIVKFAFEKCVLNISKEHDYKKSFFKIKRIYIALDPHKRSDIHPDNIECKTTFSGSSKVELTEQFIRIEFTDILYSDTFDKPKQITLFNKKNRETCFFD